MELYNYQKQVAHELRNGYNVILQAPTGAGKTLAALWPYMEIWDRECPELFPRKCVYSVPMRVLAKQFVAGYRDKATRLGIDRRMKAVIQTGDRPDDPLFESDLIFTTIDQTLSNLLCVPYSVGARRANINAGAVVSSYLVFDEFHLFPPEGALTTTIQLLRLLKDTTPFMLMTATFSRTMLQELAKRLDAVVPQIGDNELADIETRWGQFSRRERKFHVVDTELVDADAILTSHQGKQRSIVICNTVDRARGMFDRLEARDCCPLSFDAPELDVFYREMQDAYKPQEREEILNAALDKLYELISQQDDWESVTWVLLLHARFMRSHRDLKEEFVRREFGPQDDGEKWQIPSIILVSTQAIEVGLDITSDVLHTEIAPAASVLQRAGRCARFPGQQGEVYIYRVPKNKRDKPNYAPYTSKIGNTNETAVCELSWDAFAKRAGNVLRFADEQEVINAAHREADAELLKEMDESEGYIWQVIEDAIVRNEVSARRELIRKLDSRTLLVHDNTEELGNPYHIEGFSLWQGSLYGAFTGWQDRANELEDELGIEWEKVLQYPVPDIKDDEDESARQKVHYGWLPVKSEVELSQSLIFCVHPKLVDYDAARGFRFSIAEEVGGSYLSVPAREYDAADKDKCYTYQLESYQEHIRGMLHIYHRANRDELAYFARRLAEHSNAKMQMPAEMLDRAVRLAIILHDVGKLQTTWQKWARRYQEEIGDGFPEFLVAHTRSEGDEHREIARAIRPKRPKHAGESAVATRRILSRALEAKKYSGLYKAAMTAITRHHTPAYTPSNPGDIRPFEMETQAQDVLTELLAENGGDTWQEWATRLDLEPQELILDRAILQSLTNQYRAWWLLYFVIVRAVRITDGRSQEEQNIN